MADGEERDGIGTAPTVAHDSEGELQANVTLRGHGGTSTSAVGRVIADKYELVAELGAGGMGTVYEARHVDLPKRFALKLLRSERSWDPKAVKRFRREAYEAAALEHPAIVDVTDFGQTEAGEVYLVMELLEGRPLDDLVADGPLPIRQAVTLAIDVLGALEAAHARGLVHRDIKPENLFLATSAEGNQQVKLLDFGIAKAAQDGPRLTVEGTFIGTPVYMSLEQMRDSAEVDARADVYSLGATLFHLLTGYTPVEGRSASAVMTAVIEGNIVRDPRDRRPEVPAWLAEVVIEAMARDPEDRYASATALREALEAGLPQLVDDPLTDEPSSAQPRSAPPSSGTVPEDVGVAETIDMAPSAPPRRSSAPPPPESSAPAITSPDTLSVPEEPSLTAAELVRRKQLEQLRSLGVGAALVLGGVIAYLVFSGEPEPGPPAVPTASAEPSAQPPPSASAPEPPEPPEPPSGMAAYEAPTFQLGSTAEEMDAARAWCGPEDGCDRIEREGPAHEVRLGPFALDQNEVTNRAFAAWLDELEGRGLEDQVVHQGDRSLVVLGDPAAGLVASGGDVKAAPGREDHPVAFVTWFGARRFCAAQGKRLPTEAEWSWAARGASRRVFPWGAQPLGCEDAVFARRPGMACEKSPLLRSVLAPTEDRTPEGVTSLGGSLREWVADLYVERYAPCDGPCDNPGRGADRAESATATRVVRGGGWPLSAFATRAARRSFEEPGVADSSIGFRCARDLPSR